MRRNAACTILRVHAGSEIVAIAIAVWVYSQLSDRNHGGSFTMITASSSVQFFANSALFWRKGEDVYLPIVFRSISLANVGVAIGVIFVLMREKATGSIFLGELALAFLALFRLCCYVVVHKLQNNDLFGEGMSATGGGQQQWTVMERSTDIQQHHHHNSNFNAEYHPQASDHQIAAAEQQTEIQAAAIELQLQRIEDRELEMLEGQRHHATMVEQEQQSRELPRAETTKEKLRRIRLKRKVKAEFVGPTPKDGKAVVGESKNCSICLEVLAKNAGHENRALECGHVFHRVCVGKWMETSRLCPECRYPFVVDS